MLALETSGVGCSVALLDNEILVHRQDSPHAARTTQVLAPMIERALKAVAWRADQLQLVAVTQGPGSFTGLRIGVTTAKTLAYATGAALVGVSTLEVIARQAATEADTLWAVLDAQRRQLFAARFARPEAKPPHPPWQCTAATAIVDRESFMAQLRETDAVTGPGLAALRQQLALRPEGTTIQESQWAPQAETVGLVAAAQLAEKGADDLWGMSPEYYRQSAAEEKLRDKEGRQGPQGPQGQAT